ncbi:type I-B CRISPR-associated protein Cas5b [Aquifex pyrophilus]
MRVLKFELFSPCATFKTPFSIKGVETYPLPPYSTIIGLLYTALGRKWKGERFRLSVQGNHESVFRDYVSLKKYNYKDKELEKVPLEIPRLYNLTVKVHVQGEEELLKEFKKALEQPRVYLFLSGGEYPVLVKDIKLLEAEKRYIEEELLYSAFIPAKEDISLYSKGIYYRIPYFCRFEEERECEWAEVYYYQKGTDFEGEVFVDEEGEPLWL